MSFSQIFCFLRTYFCWTWSPSSRSPVSADVNWTSTYCYTTSPLEICSSFFEVGASYIKMDASSEMEFTEISFDFSASVLLTVVSIFKLITDALLN